MPVEVPAPIAGSVWVHLVSVGHEVAASEPLLVMESMKMEYPVETPVAGEVIWMEEAGKMVDEGAIVALVEPVA